jgi:hypothetical protein
MITLGKTPGFLRPRLGAQILVSLMSLALVFATLPENLAASQATSASQDQVPPANGQASQGAQAPPYAQQTPEQLQRLVAPIPGGSHVS